MSPSCAPGSASSSVPGSAAATLAFIKLLSEKLARDTGIAIHWRAGIGRSSPVVREAPVGEFLHAGGRCM